MENDQDPEIEQQIDSTDDVQDDTDTTDYKALYEERMAEDARRAAAREKRKAFIKAAEKPITNNPEQEGELARRLKNLERVEEKRQYQSEHGLNAEETDYIFTFSKGKPTKDTLEHPFIKAGLEGIRAQRRVDNNTPASSSRGLSFQGKPFAELSKEERQAAYEEKLKGVRK